MLCANCRYKKIYERHTADRPEQEIVRAQDRDETHNQQGGAVSPEPQIVREQRLNKEPNQQGGATSQESEIGREQSGDEAPNQQGGADSQDPVIVRNYLVENIEEIWKRDLGTEIKSHLKKDCAECGEGVCR